MEGIVLPFYNSIVEYFLQLEYIVYNINKNIEYCREEKKKKIMKKNRI